MGDEGYISISEVWPRELWELRQKALELAKLSNRIHGNMHTSEAAELNDAREAIIAHYLVDTQPYVDRAIADMPEGAYSRARLLALERDHFRCVLCGHTRVNAGGVSDHHIVPRKAFNDGCVETKLVPRLHCPENLASLCQRCHEECHANWRKAMPGLFEAIGYEVPTLP